MFASNSFEIKPCYSLFFQIRKYKGSDRVRKKAEFLYNKLKSVFLMQESDAPKKDEVDSKAKVDDTATKQSEKTPDGNSEKPTEAVAKPGKYFHLIRTWPNKDSLKLITSI